MSEFTQIESGMRQGSGLGGALELAGPLVGDSPPCLSPPDLGLSEAPDLILFEAPLPTGNLSSLQVSEEKSYF